MQQLKSAVKNVSMVIYLGTESHRSVRDPDEIIVHRGSLARQTSWKEDPGIQTNSL